MMATLAPAFDAVAADYDADFTRTRIGLMMRRRVWERCARRFPVGSRVLEMNCGTGEDARWLSLHGIEVLATDISAAMLEVAERKARFTDEACAPVQFARLAWEDLGALDAAPFDGALSNFGGLNCIADLEVAAANLAAKLKPGAVAILCVMGPLVPWEWAWYLAHGQPGKAFRRLRRAGLSWRGITIRYPSARRLRSDFGGQFRCLRIAGLGAVLPPPYSEPSFARRSRLLGMLERVERTLETCRPLPQLADHYLIELQRR